MDGLRRVRTDRRGRTKTAARGSDGWASPRPDRWASRTKTAAGDSDGWLRRIRTNGRIERYNGWGTRMASRRIAAPRPFGPAPAGAGPRSQSLCQKLEGPPMAGLLVFGWGTRIRT